ncbi:MAG TPA: methyltransferase domain-containing protein, partial [Candidatus Limnocylindria bacterium]|nr:methyltransferase domain-containing protein [Candidatus Limnocylindria bacterium]
MYRELDALLKKPPLYEKTPEKFWDDPHISAGMLEAHLDPTTDAASRRPQTIARSAAWIASLLPRGARLLDLGCGPGLYAKRFSELGLRVTGMDLSARSVAWAREHDPDSEYVLGNYLEMDIEGAFDAATLIWCDYGALVPQDRATLLRNVRRALKPGGLFLLDTFTPRRYDGFKERTWWERSAAGGFWSPNPHMVLGAEYLYEGHVGLSRYVVLEDGNARAFNIWDTAFTPGTLAAELRAQGFEPMDFYSDMEGNPYR